MPRSTHPSAWMRDSPVQTSKRTPSAARLASIEARIRSPAHVPRMSPGLPSVAIASVQTSSGTSAARSTT